MWLNKDLEGLICACCTYLILFGVSWAIKIIAIFPLGNENFIDPSLWSNIYSFFLIMASICHLRTLLTDPGSISKDSAMEKSINPQTETCAKCQCFKSPRTHHCSTCGRCILKMDHHCSWVNNCVGLYNQKHFILFLFYVLVCCLFTFVVFFLRATYCLWHDEANLCNKESSEASFDITVGSLVFIFTLFFSLFAGVMLHDQISCIANNTSGIDILKKSEIEKRSPKECFEEVFGGKFGFMWLLPIRNNFNQCSDKIRPNVLVKE
ncbi:unnamed protein product [Blepharisma stoltei]|uniref:Palmitoyltransferase n=1 Tax=Blepharisma stoltei TaxID=1481888 RepID=A0AAU9KFJ7_9CILI|nr:unnamed protein product [Blepharisma stoltei]